VRQRTDRQKRFRPYNPTSATGRSASSLANKIDGGAADAPIFDPLEGFAANQLTRDRVDQLGPGRRLTRIAGGRVGAELVAGLLIEQYRV
jgi:hypothetical protein